MLIVLYYWGEIMLKELTIKNFAIIEDLNIHFKDGMSVFLGETGAGKSIIIDAFSLLLGYRADTSKVRNGESRAVVEAVIDFEDIPSDLEEYKDQGNLFTFTRIINSDSNSVCKINGITVNINTLKNTLGKKVNLYSQHDLFYLLDSKFHLSLLDKFGGNDLENVKKKYEEKYDLYIDKLNYFNKLNNEQNNDDIDYLKFQLKEIEDIDLRENEIEELELQKERINKFNKINTNINGAINAFDGDNGINELLYEAKHLLSNISDDPLFSDFENRIIDLYENSKDLLSSIKSAYNSLDVDESKLSYVEDRLFKINKLKRKYGNSYEEIMAQKKEYEDKINLYDNRDFIIHKLENEVNELKDNTLKLASELSYKRKEIAKFLENDIMKELKDLYLDKTIFKVDFKNVDISKSGQDKVEFLISTNVGEKLKPLSVVASGGEASRITLGLNVVFNDIFDISLAIFDEVDSGVSGKVASSIGEKIKCLSSKYQTLVISHLPQVLAYADNFYYVYKKIDDNKTKSYVKLLNEDEKIIELAKILSGSDVPSLKFMENARELLNK